MVTAHDVRGKSKLQSLPAELRNRIYRETFNLDGTVTVTSNQFPEPALLSVCKQLRNEASPIFYAERTFSVDVSNFITEPVLAYKQKEAIVAKDFDVEMSFEAWTSAGHRRNWSNLFIALQRAHKGYPLRFPEERVDTDCVCVQALRAAFATVKNLQDLPWHRVEPIIEGYHGILAAHNRNWA